jgi:N-acetylglucosamine kinase-like BadF-type ATPase
LKYIIGIDSGATSSEAVLYPLGNGRKAIKKYPSINISVLGLDEAVKRLTGIVKDISKEAGNNNIVSVAAGISGARYEKDRRKLERAVTKASGIKIVQVLPDTETAFASVFEPSDKNCGILIAGTGSILYYKDKYGGLIKIGGWGRHIGDEGSGYWIAREALYKVTKYYDGRHKKTMLAGVLKQEFGIDSINIVKHVYHKGFEISQLTKHVFRCAERGDRVSIEIIKSAAENLLTHFIPLKNRRCRVALMGSLFSEEILLAKYLRKLAKEKFYNIELTKPKLKPVWGAVKIALSKI